MSRASKIVICLVATYLLMVGLAWVWLDPRLVDARVHKRISLGAPASEVVAEFHVAPPFDIESSAHCGTNGPSDITRIALYNAGGVILLPLPMSVPTTTTFCFDSGDRLVAIKSARWIDGP